MDSDSVILLVFGLGLVLMYLIRENKVGPDQNPDDRCLINDPSLPYIDLRGYGFENRDGRIGFFGERLFDFPNEYSLGGFFFKDKNSGDEPSPYFLIYGWTIKNLDPDHPFEKYYENPLLTDEKGRNHVLVTTKEKGFR